MDSNKDEQSSKNDAEKVEESLRDFIGRVTLGSFRSSTITNSTGFRMKY